MQIKSKFFYFFVFLFTIFSTYAENFDKIGIEELVSRINGKPYLRYDFGLSKLNTMIIADADSVFSVFILDDNPHCSSNITVGKKSILSWAFNDAVTEIGNIEHNTTEDYNPFYHKLVLIDGDIETVLDSSSQQLIGKNRKQLNRKLKELRSFLFKLWVNTLSGIDET